MSLTFMYITNDDEVALIAEKCGVERIWIDLETLGKEERQFNMNTVKSDHTVADIRRIKPLLTTSSLLVRVNPWNETSVEEIDAVIGAGADLVMLPMWKTAEEVQMFLRAVNGRSKTVLLLETKEAADCLDDILQLPGIDEIHIGLNDLHLSYKMTFMFEPLANGMVEAICKKIDAAGIPYGFGGIARLGYGDLPAEKIVMEHYRLGSTRAILSRSFCDAKKYHDMGEVEQLFTSNMRALREYEAVVAGMSSEALEQNRLDVQSVVAQIVERKRGTV